MDPQDRWDFYQLSTKYQGQSNKAQSDVNITSDDGTYYLSQMKTALFWKTETFSRAIKMQQ